ncbi:MAG: hypothetical protein WB952_18670 [Terriglobales bacterium]
MAADRGMVAKPSCSTVDLGGGLKQFTDRHIAVPGWLAEALVRVIPTRLDVVTFLRSG